MSKLAGTLFAASVLIMGHAATTEPAEYNHWPTNVQSMTLVIDGPAGSGTNYILQATSSTAGYEDEYGDPDGTDAVWYLQSAAGVTPITEGSVDASAIPGAWTILTTIRAPKQRGGAAG